MTHSLRRARQRCRNAPRLSDGFTLIELIVVIIILGCLAAVAVPKYVDLQGEARYAVMQGMRGTMRAAAELVHAKAVVTEQTGATGSVTLDGQTISLVYGYPDVTAAGIGRAVIGLSNYPVGQSPAGGGLTTLPWSGVYYFGYSPIDGNTNACLVEYLPATVAAGPSTNVWGDVHPSTSLGGPGAGMCRSGGGKGPGAW